LLINPNLLTIIVESVVAAGAGQLFMEIFYTLNAHFFKKYKFF